MIPAEYRDAWWSRIKGFTWFLELQAEVVEYVELLRECRRLDEATVFGQLREIARLRAEVIRVRGLINVDRTGLAAGLAEVRKLLQGYNWIPDGHWGSYSDEEQSEALLRKEVGYAFAAIEKVAKEALAESGRRADSAFRPEKDTAE